MTTPTFIMSQTLDVLQIKVSAFKHRMQPSNKIFFEIDNEYFCVCASVPPDILGSKWKQYSNQYYAKRYNTIIWVSEKINDNLNIR